MEVFAFSTCSRTRRAPTCWRVFASTSYGCAFCSTCCISVMITVVAMPLATSPALYPPMPSASTTSPFAASAATESSLCDRTMPGSLELLISTTWVRSILGWMAVSELKNSSKLDVDCAAGRRRRRRSGCPAERRAQRARELLPGLEALVRILRHRTIQERHHRGRNGRINRENIRGVLVGDLEHQLRHRLALEGQLAA